MEARATIGPLGLRGWPASGTARRLPYLVAAGVAATVAARIVTRATGHRLGAPLAPFFASWQPHAAALAVPAALALRVAAALGPTLVDRPRSPLAFAAGALALGLALRLALAAARGRPPRRDAGFSPGPPAAHAD